MEVEYSYLLILRKVLIMLLTDFLSVKKDSALFQWWGIEADGNLCREFVLEKGS